MPIIGKTDTPRKSRFPNARGKFSKGGKMGTSSRGKFKGGDDLEGFRFESREKGIAALMGHYYPDAVIGSVRIILPYLTIDKVFPTWVERRGPGDDGKDRVLWRSDGEMTVGRYLKGRNVWSEKEADQIPINLDDFEGDRKVQWVGRLYFAVAEMAEAYPGAVFLMRTTSKSDCINITQTLFDIVEENGDLRGVACQMYRQAGKMEYELKGEKKTRKNWFVMLEQEHNWLSRQRAAALTPVIEGQTEKALAPVTPDPEPPAFIPPDQGAMEAPTDYSTLYTMVTDGKIPTIEKIPHMVNWITNHCGNTPKNTPIAEAWATIQAELFAPPPLPAEQAISLAETNDPAAILDENEIPF